MAESDLGVVYHQWSKPGILDALGTVTSWGGAVPLYKTYPGAARVHLGEGRTAALEAEPSLPVAVEDPESPHRSMKLAEFRLETGMCRRKLHGWQLCRSDPSDPISDLA